VSEYLANNKRDRITIHVSTDDTFLSSDVDLIDTPESTSNSCVGKQEKFVGKLMSAFFCLLLIFSLFTVAAFGQASGSDNQSESNTIPKELASQTIQANQSSGVYTVTFKNWDGSVFFTTQAAEGADALLPQDPSRDGYEFIGWTPKPDNVQADLEIVAKFVPVQMQTVTVNYLFEDGTEAARPVVISVHRGYPLHRYIQSPTVIGYAPDRLAVPYSSDAVTRDTTITVTYKPAFVTPTITTLQAA
jgi:hypothetical protein